MTATGVTYCMDSSAWIDAAVNYPPEAFPSFWSRLDDLANRGRIVSPGEVRVEVQKKSNFIATWTKGRPHLFVPLDETLMQRATLILSQFPGMALAGGKQNTADPWVVALACERGLTVVTQERGGSPQFPRIPKVCTEFKVPCIKLIQLVINERWTF
ncbi:MAG: hypothetical protein AMXMBFR77_28140 [Phycisphaerales bacterium]